jgi:hypothetical protein
MGTSLQEHCISIHRHQLSTLSPPTSHPSLTPQPHGLSCADNIIKECWEEAGIPQQLAAAAVPVGFVSYVSWSEEGLKPDVLFCYDLQLPPDFVPVPQDGEVRKDLGRGQEHKGCRSRAKSGQSQMLYVVLVPFIRLWFVPAPHRCWHTCPAAAVANNRLPPFTKANE